MTDTVAWRGWLLDPAPASRRQARLGRWYRAWMAFQHNGLAMTGLGVVLALVLMALIAPLTVSSALRTAVIPPAAWHSGPPGSGAGSSAPA